MFQTVTLVSHRPNEEPTIEIVRARPIGRAYVWSDPAHPGAGGVSLLFEGENGMWYVQEINHFPDPFCFFAFCIPFLSFEDVQCTFPDEVKYILS